MIMGNITSMYQSLIRPAFQQPYTEGSAFESEIFCEYINNKGLPVEQEVSLTKVGIEPQEIQVKQLMTQWLPLLRFIKRRTQLPDFEIKRLMMLIEDYSFNTSSQSFDFVLWNNWDKQQVVSVIESNGLFHYQPVSNTVEYETEFAKQLVKDYIKYRELAKLNINFYEYNAARYHSSYTPVWEKEKIRTELDKAFCCV